MRREPLLAFFLLAFALAWPPLILDALTSQGVVAGRVPWLALVLVGYAPTIAAWVVTRVSEGRAGVRTLMRRLLVWRVGPAWFGAAVFGMAGLFYLANRLAVWSGEPAPAAAALPVSPLLAVPVLFLVNLIVNGEEIGWRGFALPRLQERFGALAASVILGLVWAGFHAPLFWTVGSSQHGQPVLGFVVGIVASSVIVTSLFNGTGSLLVAVLFHASVNTWSRIVPGVDPAVAGAGPVYAWTTALLCTAAVLAVIFLGPRHLTRRPGGRVRTFSPHRPRPRTPLERPSFYAPSSLERDLRP